MAFRADIEIGVRGVRYLDELQNKLTEVSKTIEQVNKQNVVVRRTIAGAASAVPMGPGGSGVTSASAQAAALAVEKRVGEMRRAETQAEIKVVKDRAFAENYISGVINRRLQAKQQELAVEQKITAEQQRQASVASRQRAGNIASNAIIGGAFPLLFGQGAGAAVGGGVGGALGGALGGTLGFGLSLVGTAIGQAVDDAKKLNAELTGLNNNLDSTGTTSRTTASDISNLADRLGIAKDEALKLVAAFSEFSSANIRESLAASFGAVGGEEAFNALAAAIDNKSTLEAIVKLRDTINDTQAKEALKQLEINGSAAANAFLQQRLIELQEQKLIKVAEEVTLMDRLLAAAAALGAQGQYIDPAVFGQERAQNIKKGAAERKKAQDQALKDTRNFLESVSRLTKQYSAKTPAGKKPPEDRTAVLQADLQALIEMGNAENMIRDYRFENRDLLIPEVELLKTLADIDRDRVQQLKRANYETEKFTINKIAQARIYNAERLAADNVRQIEKQRADNFANVIRNVQYEIQLTNARIAGTEPQVTIEQKIADLKREQTYLNAEQLQQYKDLLELANQRKEAEETAALQRQVETTGKGLRAGFTGPAAAAFEEQLAAGKSLDRATEVAQLTEQLQLAQIQAQGLEGSVLNIGGAFATAMTTGVAALINGTKTAEQVFADFLNSVASALLDAAAQMIATYIAIGIARQFAGFGSKGGETNTQFMDRTAGLDLAGDVPIPAGFANGGYPPVGQASLVGENGPELFVPGRQGLVVPNDIFAATRAALNSGSSKGGDAFAENAQALTVSNSYTRERTLERERQTMLTGAGGSMVIETQVINNVEYATVDQVAQAASASAKQARAQVFADMRNKPSTRASLGMR